MEQPLIETVDEEAYSYSFLGATEVGGTTRPAVNIALPSSQTILFAALGVHFIVFALIALLTQPTLPLDVIEQVSWARNLEWTYFKHPPLPAWCLAALMALTGGRPWIAALAGPAATTLALWIVWLLARRIFDPIRALLAVLLLEGVVHFNILSLEFNHNIIQLPLWAFIAYASHRAVREGRLQDWIVFGFAAALGMLGKYSTALLLFSVGGYILYDPKARKQLAGKGPWIGVLTGTLLLIPDIVGLYGYDFYPFRFPLDRVKEASSFGDRIIFPLGWLLAQLLDAAPAAILAAVLLTGKGTKVSVRKHGVEAADRTFILFLALGPLFLTAALQGLWGVRFKDMWGCPMLDFMGLAIMALVPVGSIGYAGLKRFGFSLIGVFSLAAIAMTIQNMATPYILHRGGRIQFPSQATVDAVAKGWDRQTGNRPLKIVIGDNWTAGLLSAYHPDHPSILISGDWFKSPWISKHQLSEDGAVLIWQGGAPGKAAPLLSEFPDAIEQPELTLPFVTGAAVPPAHIRWAILPPLALKTAAR